MKMQRGRKIHWTWALAGAILALYVTGCSPQPSPKNDDDFLERIKSETSANPSIAQEGVGALPPAAASPSNAAPAIELNASTVDLGVVPNDNYYVTTVPVYNRGAADLVIGDVQTTCACTMGKMKEATIKPGSQGELEITIVPYKIPGFSSQKTLIILSNDPKHPRLSLEVHCKVDPEFEVEPSEIVWGKIQKGERAESILHFRALQNVKIAGQPDQPVTVGGVTAIGQPRGLSSEIEPLPEDAWTAPGLPEYRIRLMLDTTELPLGAYAASFQIVTSAPRVPRFMSGVKAEIVSFYAIAPPTITVQKIQPGETIKDAAVISSQSQAFELKDVAVGGDSLTVATRPGPSPNSVAIDLTAAPNALEGHKQETITFTLSSGDETLKDSIRVFAIVSKSPTTP